MGSRSRDRGGGECWGPGGRTFVTPLRYTNCGQNAGQERPPASTVPVQRKIGCLHHRLLQAVIVSF